MSADISRAAEGAAIISILFGIGAGISWGAGIGIMAAVGMFLLIGLLLSID